MPATPLQDAAIHAAIQRQMEQNGGRMTADELVEAARNRRHPAHDHLWRSDRDEVFADWQRQEAGKLIASVRFKTFITPIDEQARRFAVRDPTATAPPVSWVRIATVAEAGDADLTASVLEYALRHAKRQIQHVADVGGQLGLRQEVLDRLSDLIQTLRLVRDPRIGPSPLPSPPPAPPPAGSGGSGGSGGGSGRGGRGGRQTPPPPPPPGDQPEASLPLAAE